MSREKADGCSDPAMSAAVDKRERAGRDRVLGSGSAHAIMVTTSVVSPARVHDFRRQRNAAHVRTHGPVQDTCLLRRYPEARWFQFSDLGESYVFSEDGGGLLGQTDSCQK